MAYTNPLHIANGLELDFTVQAADTALDAILGRNTDGELTSFTSIPRARVSGGGNVIESTSDILTITGGSAAVLTSGLTIQVKQAATAQSGYLSSTDWNTFNNKLSTTLTSANVFVGNGSNVATGVAITGDIAITNAGVVSITANSIVNADINSSAGIAFSKMAALTASLVTVTDGSGFITTVSGFTSTRAGYLTTLTSNVQTQLDAKDSLIVGFNISTTLDNPSTTENGYAIIWDFSNTRWTLGPVGAGGSVTGPGSSTDTAIVRWNGTGGTSLSNSAVLIDGSNNITGANSITVNTAGLHLLDTDASHDLIFVVGSNLTADRNLVITTGDAARTITLSGNPTLDDWFDQAVKTSSSAIFADVTLSNTGGLHLLDSDSSHDLIIRTTSDLTADRQLVFVTGDATRTLTINASGTVYVTGGTDVSLADGGTGASLANPGADRVMFWDDSAGAVTWLTMGTNLSITGTTLDASGGGANPFSDNVALVKNNADNTKLAILSADNITTATTRTYSLPDFNGNIVATGGITDIGTTPIQLIGNNAGNSDLYFLMDNNATQSDRLWSLGFNAQLNSYPVSGDEYLIEINSKRIGWGGGGTYWFEVNNLTSTVNKYIAIDAQGLNFRLNVGSDAIGDTYQRDASGYFSRLASVATGNVLISGGLATVNSWGKVGLTTHVSGNLPVANGGTGVTTITAKSIWIANAANTITEVTPAAGQSIRINAGNTAWEAYTPSSGSGITIGTTTITSGTDTRILYNNAGVVGEYPLTNFYSTASGGTATGTNTFAMGTNPFIMTTSVSTGSGATAGFQLESNSLTTGNGFDVSSSSLTTGFLAKFTSTSTVLNYVAGTSGIVGIASSGANSTSSKIAIGLSSIVTNTGTTSTNIAGYFAASGATTNLAIRTSGSVRVDGDLTFQKGSSVSFGTFDNNQLFTYTNSTIRQQIGTDGSYSIYNIPRITITQSAISGSIIGGYAFTYNGGAHTFTGTAQEVQDVYFSLNRTVRFPGSTSFTSQRAFLIDPPTYTYVSATGTITNAGTFVVSGAPIAGTNAIITNPYSIWVQSGNIAFGGGATASELRFLEPSGSGSNYIGFKSPALAGNTVYDLPDAFPAVTGYVLSSTDAGVMSWIAAGGGITNGAANTELAISNGTNLIGGKIFSAANGNLTLGDTGLSGSTRTITTSGSATDVSFAVTAKGGGFPFVGTSVSITGSIYLAATGIGTDWLGGGSPFTIYTTAQSGATNSTGIQLTSGNVITGIAGNIDLQTGSITGGTEGSVNIQKRSTGKLSFFGVTAVIQQAGLTAITHTAPGTPDYSIQDLTNVGGFGFVTKDEGNTFISVVKAMHDAMKLYGMLS